MGGPISWIAVREYSSFFKYDEYQALFLFEAIRAMDNVFLESREDEHS